VCGVDWTMLLLKVTNVTNVRVNVVLILYDNLCNIVAAM